MSGESKHRLGHGLQEMYQMPEEMEGNTRQGRVAELGGDGAHSPVELRGDNDVVELHGSAH